MNDFLRVLHNRKSVRHFTDEKVSYSVLEKIVAAGMAAPSARNMQPWEFLIITNEKLLSDLADALPYAKMLADVSSAIVVLGDSSVKSPSGYSYWVQDACAATENILLAVESLELGAVWTALYPYEDRIYPVRKACNIPAHIVPLNIIPVGVPARDNRPINKFKPNKIHKNIWGER